MKTSHFSTCIFSFLIFVAIGSCRLQETLIVEPVSANATLQAEKIINEVFRKENLPGLAIDVWKNGKSIYAKGFGYSDIENKIAVDPKSSQFRIGSVSKPFTAAGLAMLYEQDKIDLDQAIQTYVPSFPIKDHPVNLRQLAGHLGGIRHYQGMEFLSNVHYFNVTDGLYLFINDPLINTPGTKYSYSSYGWNLISAAMEHASGEEFLEYMTAKIFEPTGMSHTVADDNTATIPNKVTFYVQQNKKNQIAPTVDNSYKWAGGGFLSTAHDMALFAQAHLDATILKRETIELWTKSQYTSSGEKINYGIGWRSGEDKKGRHWYGHSGGSVGGSSMLLIFPEEELIVAMAINLSQARYGNLPFRVAEQFISASKE